MYTCEYCMKTCLSQGGLTNHQNSCPVKRHEDRIWWMDQGFTKGKNTNGKNAKGKNAKGKNAKGKNTQVNHYYHYNITNNDNSTTIIIQQQIVEKYCASMDRSINKFLATALEGIRTLAHLPKEEVLCRLIQGVEQTGNDVEQNILLALLDKEHSFSPPDELEDDRIEEVQDHLAIKLEEAAKELNEAF